MWLPCFFDFDINWWRNCFHLPTMTGAIEDLMETDVMRIDVLKRTRIGENFHGFCLFTYILLATWYKPDPTSILLMTQGKLQKSISKLRYGRLVINLETWKTNRLIDQSSIHCSFLQNTRRRQKIMWSSETFAQLCAPVRSSCPQRSFIGQPRSILFATCPPVTHRQRLWSGSSSGV